MLAKNATNLKEFYSVDPFFRPMLKKLGFERYNASEIVSYKRHINREFKVLAYSDDAPSTAWAGWFPSDRPKLILELKPSCRNALSKATVRSLSDLETAVRRWRAGFPYQDDPSGKGTDF